MNYLVIMCTKVLSDMNHVSRLRGEEGVCRMVHGRESWRGGGERGKVRGNLV